MFLRTILNCNRFKYTYGRKVIYEKIAKDKIYLPIKRNEDGTPIVDEVNGYTKFHYVPNWEYMNQYIKSLNSKKITTNRANLPQMDLHTERWQDFYLKDLFICRMGSKIDAGNTTSYHPKYNYVSRDSNDNGVVDFVDEMLGYTPFEAGELTLALGGSYLGACFIQTAPFYTAQNVAVLKEREPVPLKAKLFITTLIRNEAKKKYIAFGRELNTLYKKDFSIRLPIQHDENGNPVINYSKKYSKSGFVPDWQFMVDYINSLPYSEKIK